MSDEIAQDKKARERAVEPDKSFIVRAPAGSGKTDLLIRRYLKLLSLVDSPEEIIAVTFTNKATNEMRRKVLNNLDDALSKKQPDDKHEEDMISLANDVLKRNNEKGWHLMDSPDRLRIQTIDGLCAYLTQRMPILAKFGAHPDVTDDAKPLYEHAIAETLNSLNKDEKFFHLAKKIILHCGNDIAGLRKSIINMLETRDLWQNSLFNVSIKEMQQELKDRIKEELESVAEIFYQEVECQQVVVKLLDLPRFPDCDIKNLSVWHDISEKLLTRTGTWRKTAIVKSLIEKLKRSDLLRKRLEKIADLPDSAESLEEGWDLIDPAKELLQRISAQLEITFAKRNLIDFTGISQHAVSALGDDDDDPTDIALSLDYQVKHLLVDEVQDVSDSQYELLRRLTREWSAGDGRTLFLVGDPQQAIYGFRGADVRFFQDTFNQKTLKNIDLEPLTLKQNFRSSPYLVNWSNEIFTEIFPEKILSEGAVEFVNSVAANTENKNSDVESYCVYGNVDTEEEKKILEIIKKIKKTDPEEKKKIAILVRSRSHITKIIPTLKRRGISFNANDIFELSDLPIIQDLLALTRAFLFPGDRTAWLACLRAPWCGLTINSLSILCEENKKDTIWQCIGNNKLVSRLQKDEKKRLENFKLNMQTAIKQHATPTRDIIESLWYRLGGPAVLKDENEFDYAKDYFSVLEEVTKGGMIADFQELKRRIDELYVSVLSDKSNPVNIMTIHKAKGLEFDHVILPGLNRPSGSSENPLLITLPDSNIAAVGPRPGEETQSNYDFIYALKRRIEQNEERRILYVAATRASETIHLIAGNLKRVPYKGSSLWYLWPGIANLFEKEIEEDEYPTKEDKIYNQKTRRLRSNWTMPEDIQEESLWTPPIENITEDDHEVTEFEWAGETIKIVGIVVHRTLQQIAEDGTENWTTDRLKSEEKNFKKLLHQYGVPLDEREKAISYIIDALINILNDERGQWILSNNHGGRHNEYPVSGVVNNRLIKRVMDRTFLDKDGIRWIIDYKTSPHEGTNLETFLDQEKQRYQPKLEGYAALMEGLGEKNIKLGLYFPLLKGWREWEYKQ